MEGEEENNSYRKKTTGHSGLPANQKTLLCVPRQPPHQRPRNEKGNDPKRLQIVVDVIQGTEKG